MNRKGFTITELVLVILLLLLIFSLSIPTIVKLTYFENIEELRIKVKAIESSAERYGEDNLDSINRFNCSYVNVKFLIDNGYLKGEGKNHDDYINPRTKNSMLTHRICIIYEYNEANNSFEINSYYKRER